MNFKYLFLLLGATALFSCSDTLSNIGSSIQPESDIVTLSADTIYLNNNITTFKADSIYSLSNTALLGSFSDGTYGDLQCDFMAQINCVDDFSISEDTTHTIIKKIKDLTVTLECTGYIGDSLAPLQVSVYQLNNQLTKESYSNSNASKYCDKSILLGRKSYSIAGGIKKKSVIQNVITFDTLEISLNDNFKAKYLDALQHHPEWFKDAKTFQDNFLPGIYVTNTYGSGMILKIERIQLNVYYDFYKLGRNATNTADSILHTYPLVSSMGVTETNFLANRYKNNLIDQLASNTTPNVTYLKSPAGLFNRLKMPMKMLISKVGTSKLNGAKLIFHADRVDKTKTSYPNPPALMLVRESELTGFFNHSIDMSSKKHSIATFTAATNTYTFSNLSAVLSEYINGNETFTGDDVDFVLLPVNYVTDSSGNITKIIHLHEPSAVTLNTSADMLNLSLIFAK
ncbi:MAG: DUF4270 domain-containing protein [Bacteroidales bacterium]|nr:DUF4270 domain-containing protein [Bacteroidales bacterium]